MGITDKILTYYKNKKVFVTGHTGFKGAWLMALLHKAGAIIKGYALPPEYANGLFDVLGPLQIAENCFADIRHRETLEKEIISFQPEFIFHLAAQPLVRRSYEIPAETFETNVSGTANLLEVAGKLPAKCTMVVITTDKVYENREMDVLYTEEDVLGGYDPYSASKACTELVVHSFRNAFFNTRDYSRHRKALASARAGNVIGGGDWSTDRLVPDIVRALESGHPVVIRNPFSIRPWQHVLDPLYGYLMLGKMLDQHPEKYSKAFNFGPEAGDHLAVRDLVEKAIQVWGKGTWEDFSGGVQPHEASILKLDISRAKKELAWRPLLSGNDAIQWTMDWYKKPGQEKADFTFHQINQYLNL